MEGDQLKPTDEDTRTDGLYTVGDDGKVTVGNSWKYYAISLGSPLNLATVKSIKFTGSASQKWRLSFGNKANEYFINHDVLDSWTFPEAFNGEATIDLTGLSPCGEADWIFLGVWES